MPLALLLNRPIRRPRALARARDPALGGADDRRRHRVPLARRPRSTASSTSSAVARASSASRSRSLGDPRYAIWAVTLATAWKGLPLVFILVLSSLQSLDPQYLEAARVDGAPRCAASPRGPAAPALVDRARGRALRGLQLLAARSDVPADGRRASRARRRAGRSCSTTRSSARSTRAARRPSASSIFLAGVSPWRSCSARRAAPGGTRPMSAPRVVDPGEVDLERSPLCRAS